MATAIEIDAEPAPRLWTTDEFWRMQEAGIIDDRSTELVLGVLTIKTTGQPHRFTVPQYHALGELGLFESQRVQLIDGEIILMSPQGANHAYQIHRLAKLLQNVFISGEEVITQLPIRPPGDSEPEPDVSVVRQGEFTRQSLARRPLLAVEISDSTLRFDRDRKSGLYARAEIPEYWIVNLRQRQVEVFRNPVEDQSHSSGWRYLTVTIHREGGEIRPLAADRALSVSEIFA
jgi:Uma2 family endonuclease